MFESTDAILGNYDEELLNANDDDNNSWQDSKEKFKNNQEHMIVNDSFYSYGTRTVSYFIKNIPCRQEQERIEFDVTNYDAMIRGTSTGPTTIGRMRKMTCTVAHQYGRWHLTLDVDV